MDKRSEEHSHAAHKPCTETHIFQEEAVDLQVVKSGAVEGDEARRVGGRVGAGHARAAGQRPERAQRQHTAVQQHLLQVPPRQSQRQQRRFSFCWLLHHGLRACMPALLGYRAENLAESIQ